MVLAVEVRSRHTAMPWSSPSCSVIDAVKPHPSVVRMTALACASPFTETRTDRSCGVRSVSMAPVRTASAPLRTAIRMAWGAGR